MVLRSRIIVLSSLIIVTVLGLVIFGIDHDGSIDPSSLEYLKALQELCKQNENSNFTSMIDGPRWQNATHYFDVPDCQLRKLIILDNSEISENEN